MMRLVWRVVWLAVLLLALGCRRETTREVIVYASQDQVYAEPILHEFTRSTGIKVRAVYDSEAVKTVGLANRLLREESNPQCDVFWNNEELRTRQLAARGVLRETNAWIAIGYRSRRIVVNTNFLSTAKAPSSLASLTNAEWRGKCALAYPLFGTTATHFLALRQHWGPERWEKWCRALHANKPLLLEGNSMVVNFVGRGEAWIGLTDSDDISAGQRSGLPVVALPLTDESLLIPNTVALVRGLRNPHAADELSAFLRQPNTIQRLIAAGALEGAQATQTGLMVNWTVLLNDLDYATDTLRAIFLR
jgi:iron(III) transport system substrate-binding protein